MTKKSIHSGSLSEALFTSQARLAVLTLLLSPCMRSLRRCSYNTLQNGTANWWGPSHSIRLPV